MSDSGSTGTEQAGRAGEVPPDARAAAPASDRLVLTPDQRVGERIGTATPEAGPPGPETDALRALVHGLMKEELRGPLGEGMTRAVRKLVRAEVAAILAARDGD